MQKQTILLVDDNKAYSRTLELALNNLGFELLVVHSPSEAVETVKKRQIDILITDFDMRVQTGDELTQCLCALQPIKKCVVMSGHNLDMNNLAYPFDLVLQKPIQLEVLEEMLASWSQSNQTLTIEEL